MKERIIRGIIYVLLLIICISLGIIGYLNKEEKSTFDKDIMDKVYYRFNTLNGNYETLKITENSIEYNGSYIDMNNCKNYTYEEETDIIKLDCNKSFKFVQNTNESLILNINNENLYFYLNQENSYNGEFQRRFQKDLNTYKTEGEEEIKEQEINVTRLLELIRRNNNSFIYVKGENCKNECTIFNKELKNFSSTSNTYYLDANKLTNEDITRIRETYKEFPQNLNDYNKDYPLVFVVGNRSLKEIIKIEGSGFDYSRYNNFADNYGVNQ